MGEAKRGRFVLGPVEMRQMDPIPVICSKCQTNAKAIPGTSHIECGGTYVPAEVKGQQYRFSTPLAMQVFMMLDRLVSDINFTAGQFNFMHQPNLAMTVGQLCTAAQQMRDAFYRQDQSGIQVVGANGIPKV